MWWIWSSVWCKPWSVASQRLLPPTLLRSTSLQFCRFPVLSLTLVPLTFNSFITALQPIIKSYQVFPSLCCIYTLKDWNITLEQCTLVQLAVCHLGFGFVVKFAVGTEKQQRAVSPNLLWLWQQQMPTVLHRAFNTCTPEPFQIFSLVVNIFCCHDSRNMGKVT